MAIEAKNFDHLLGNLKLSDKLLRAHFKLYEGYVRKLNEIEELRENGNPSEADYSFAPYSELLRREPTAYNGTVLHELYFENLAPAEKTSPDALVMSAIERSYGSMDRWIADMKAAGKSAHGWALTVWDPFRGKICTNLIHSEHHAGLMADVRILVALDVWEHAYALDYGTGKEKYLEAFFENLDWEIVSRRLTAARKTPESLEAVAR